MNTQPHTPTITDTSTTARKALGIAFSSAIKRREEARTACEVTRKIAEDNKTPTGKYKRIFKNPLNETIEALIVVGSEIDIIRKAIIETERKLKASDRAAVGLAVTERLSALTSTLGLSEESHSSSEWSKQFDLWVLKIKEKDNSFSRDNPFGYGKRMAFNLSHRGEVFEMSPERYQPETKKIEVQMHLVIDFDELGQIDAAKIYCGTPRTDLQIIGSNFIYDTNGFCIDCGGWNYDFNLSSFNGSPLCVLTYAKGLALAVKVNAVLRGFPKISFSDSLDETALAAEWANL